VTRKEGQGRASAQVRASRINEKRKNGGREPVTLGGGKFSPESQVEEVRLKDVRFTPALCCLWQEKKKMKSGGGKIQKKEK